jgi:ubiquitin carboxyl-terminal hydrolase 36/42
MAGIPVIATVPNMLLATALMQTMVNIATTTPPGLVHDAFAFVYIAKGELPDFDGSGQHDGVEFFVQTLMKLPNLALLFYAETSESMRCTRCNLVWVRKAEAEFPVHLVITGLDTLHQCLELTKVSEEVVCTCEECKHDKATKSQHLTYGTHVPFVLRRFNHTGKKDEHPVNYERTILLPSWPDGEIKPYDLTAVVCHLGKMVHGGHFICFVAAENETCVRLDDHHAAVQHPVHAMLSQQSAYVIFYSVIVVSVLFLSPRR